MTTEMTSQSKKLVEELLESTAQTVMSLLSLTDEDLHHKCSHSCAQGGDIRRLIIHNTGHDREHTGNLASIRSRSRDMQESELANLMRDWLHARADLVGELMRVNDDLMDEKFDDNWSIRKHVDHILHWERDSITSVLEEAPH